MIRNILLALAGLAALAAAPAQAQVKQYKAKEVIKVAPTTAYILFRSPSYADTRLIRTPNPDEVAAYKARRAAALAKAQARYVKLKLRYDADFKDYERYKQLGQAAQRPVRPIEPTEQNFAFPPIETDFFINVMGGRVLMKEPTHAYLIAVVPGNYTLYGQLTLGGNGMIGVCMCMGSVQFEARAGVITDLGEIQLGYSTGSDAPMDQVLIRPGPATVMPPQVAGLPVVPADFRAAGKMPNYFGVLIERVAPISGVLAYERDKVIDVKASRPVASD